MQEFQLVQITDREAGLSARLDGKALRRGFLIASVLAVVFLAATAYTSAATLLGRVESTDVMRAASEGVWSGRIGMQMAYFGFAQIALHIAFGALAWLLAWCSASIWVETRAKFGRVVVGWFCLLAGATIAFNALWYPRTLMGAHYHDAMATTVGPLTMGQWIYGGVSVAALVVLGGGTVRLSRTIRGATRRHASAVAVALAGVAALLIVVGKVDLAGAGQSSGPPHVVILGIDSLRLDQIARYGGSQGTTPHLDRFLARADVFSDVTTPAARTFSSWTAILTGRSPPVTGARFNLAPRDVVAVNPTIGDVLRKAGYRTVYSTDEVRFANFDETYGFDQVVTPPIGASDFLIGTYNELPLASVVVNTRIGQLLFPFSYGNRGVATMFQPATYLSRLDREVHFDQPTLLIAHLTASHWPYYTSETPFGIKHRTDDGDYPLYRNGLRIADEMFGQVIEMLERKGALENAIVVVLSDHGEALGLPTDSFIRPGTIVTGLGAPLKMKDTGHGQSVLSPSQYRVLLGFRTFGPQAKFAANGRDLPQPVTVEDIAPTLLELLGVPASALKSSGVSLADVLVGGAIDATGDAPPERVRFTETDLSVLPRPDGGVDEAATARANAKFFEIDPNTGRLHIRHAFKPLALAFKERAAFTSKNLLAAIPAGPEAHQYLYFDLMTQRGELLVERPGSDRAEARRLWDAMDTYFAGELRPATRVTMADWPRIEYEWANFLNTPRGVLPKERS